LPKERLIATCIAEKISYVTDPSNGSVLFARGRLRNIMPLLAREGMTTDNLSQLGWRAAETKDALDHYTKEFLRSVAQEKVGGSICLDRSALRLVPRAIGLRALSACLRHIHPADYPPEYGPLSALLNTILEATEDTARTFYGCIASLTASKVTILREPSAISEILPLHAGETVLWDKRWLVTANAAATPTIIQAMGSLPHEEIDRLAPGLRRQIPQGRIRASLPSIWIGGQRLAIPSFDEKAPFHLAYRKQAFP
jgi:tRNA(Ile)-lysidine synthase